MAALNYFNQDYLRSRVLESESSSVVLRIKTALLHMLESAIEAEGPACISISSIRQLALFFRCHESDVLHSLNELEQQGYAYEAQNMDSPVLLSDPLAMAL